MSDPRPPTPIRALPVRAGALLLGALLWAGASSAADDRQIRLLVMDLEHASSVSADEARTLTDLLASEAARREAFRTVSQADLRTMVALEGDRQALGCTETSCLADLAGAIGARFVLYGRVARLGRRVILQLNLLDSETAQPVGRRAVKARDLGEAADQLPVAVGEILAPALELTGREPGAARPSDAEPALSAAVAAPPDEPATVEERAAELLLRAGELPEQEAVRSTEAEVGVKGLAGTRAVFVVEAPPALVMEALWRPEEMHEVLPGGKRSTLKREGKDPRGRRWVEVTLAEKALFVKVSYTARLMRDDERGRIDFEELEGDVEHVRGGFEIKDPGAPGFTEVVYTVFVDVGLLVPSSWARTILQDQPRDMARVLRERVKALKAEQAATRAEEEKKKKRKKKRRRRSKKRRRR